MPAGCPAAAQPFLDVDDGFGQCQPPREIGITLLRTGTFGRERIEFGDIRATPDRSQRVERAGVSLSAPIAKG
jgi:hypothetical protein